VARGWLQQTILDRPFRQSGRKSEEMDMDWNFAEGNWNQFKGKVKVQWEQLNDDHLDLIARKRDHLAGTVQETCGITRDEVEKQIKDFADRTTRTALQGVAHGPRTPPDGRDHEYALQC
jgi:uncharacterized protein YjbJ (UPF0337 family)